MQIEKQIPFKNWTDEIFTYGFDGEDHTFEAGKTYSIPAGAAVHFARHLAIRELHKSGNPADHALPEVKMKDFISRALPQGSVTNAFEEIPDKKPEYKEIETEVEDKAETAPVEEVKAPVSPKKPMGRPKKVKDEEYTA